jgi:RNA polymerase sigma-70 factor (ECF subfamily)
LEDRELIAKIKEPETKNYGFNLLVRKYQQKIYWHIRKMVIDHDDSDDLVQDVFIKIWHHLDNFREDAQLYTWIYRIATNECLNFLRKKRNKYFIPIHDLQGELNQKLESSEYIDGNEVQLKLQKALLKLPDKQRMVFNMKYFDEMKYDDIAEITGTSVGSLKASYHHAVKKIEEIIKSD